WASIFPSILRGGGELDVASTPKGRDNLFAELRSNQQFARSVVTLPDAVAAGLAVDPEEIRRSMSDDELFRQEFLCEFLDESSVFLSHELIATVEDASLDKAPDQMRLRCCKGPLYVGVDIGRCRDLTVMWVLETDGEILATRGVRESIGEPFRDQYQGLRELLSLRQVARCCIDAGGIGMALAEAAMDEFGGSRVEPVIFTTAVKDELANRLRLRVEEQKIRIPADEAIRHDWHSVRRSVTMAGPARYDAARSGGGHADRFWAACLAIRAAGQPAVAVEYLRGQGLRFGRPGIW
ncbi:MAG: phage terminase large subunit family protein, partial [Phycisphaerae bacterium]